ncbi:MAG: endonuclease/exonuclease/phosphatase family protein [Gammaproteobacteria bacterium]|nr:endonuclease/exonuclease/phosphatase family protein [Gammaproteobacteria bacterium]
MHKAKLTAGSGEGAAGSYGVGIASLTAPKSDKVFRGINGRTMLGARYLFKNQYFWLCTAHAAFIIGPRDNRRKQDFDNIVDMIKRYSPSEPIILTGDFNANRDYPQDDKDLEKGDMDVFFNEGFVDVWRQLYPNITLNPGYTWRDDRRIDYVLVRNLPAN